MQFAGSIREKPQWWEKVQDASLCAKWIAEAKEQDELFSDQNLAYMIEELRWQAANQRDGGVQPAPVDGVWQADGAVDEALQAALVAGVASLENVPEAKIDYHPGTNKQVIDLVHPSLYCFRIGYTKETQEPFGLADALTLFGAGYAMGKKPPPIDESPDSSAAADGSSSSASAAAAAAPAVGRVRRAPRRWESKGDYSESQYFAWLPAEFAVDDDGKVSIESYINNLHPGQSIQPRDQPCERRRHVSDRKGCARALSLTVTCLLHPSFFVLSFLQWSTPTCIPCWSASARSSSRCGSAC